MNLLKKLPIPIAGLILSMFALGNLLQSYSNAVRLGIGAVALILYFHLALSETSFHWHFIIYIFVATSNLN